MNYVLFLKFCNSKGQPGDTTYEYFIDYNMFNQMRGIPRGSFATIVSEDGYDYRGSKVELLEIKAAEDCSTKATKFLSEVKIISLRNSIVDIPLYSPMARKYAEPAEGKIIIPSEDSCLSLNSISLTNTINNIERKEEINMFETMFKGFKFGMAEDVKLSVYGPAFRTKDNTYVAYNKDNELIEVDGFVINTKKSMCYMVPVAKKDVAIGDFIYHNDSWTKVLGLTDDGYLRAEKINVKEVIDIIPTKNAFGFDFYVKLMPLFGDFSFDVNEKNVFGNLPMLMAFGEDKIEDFLPFFLMTQDNGVENFMKNPMMLYFLMESKGLSDFKSILPFMLMSNINNNKKGE